MNSLHPFDRPTGLQPFRTRRRRRRGVVLICALVCLSVATALMVAATHQSLIARRQGRVQLQLRQTEYLLQAGIGRAVAGLDAAGDYAGETWRPAGALPGYETVVVQIDVIPRDNEPSKRQVTVRARLGRGDLLAQRTQRSQTFLYSQADQYEFSNPE